jgi:hypothetical protein
MSEKLYNSRCSVPGHGTRCVVAEEIYPDKKRLSKLRRQNDKKVILDELSMLEDANLTHKSVLQGV